MVMMRKIRILEIKELEVRLLVVKTGLEQSA